MPEIISFYSSTPNQGKRTLSHAFAKVLANNDHKVLYVELDYKHPSFANFTQATHPTKNMNEYIATGKLKNKFDLEPFVLTKRDLVSNSEKKLKALINDLPNTLDSLAFPLDFEESYFPTIVESTDEQGEKDAFEFVKKIMYKLNNTNYDYIIMSLPNELESIFGLAVLLHSQKIVNVITPNPTRLMEYNHVIQQIKNTQIEFKNWFTVLNQISHAISIQEYYKLVDEENEPVLIPYDEERAENELSLKIGSEGIDSKMEELAAVLNIPVVQIQKRKKFFRG